MAEAKTYFAPLPLAALGDTRLSALDLRVLACIAFHDRMSGVRGKGIGAWASNETLARRVQCHYTNLSSAITRLGQLGYVEKDQHPLNKRLRVYRVIYGEAGTLPDALPDDKVLSAAADPSQSGTPANVAPLATVPELDPLPGIIGRSTNSAAAIVCHLPEMGVQNQSDEHVEYISLSDVKDSAEAGKKTPVNRRVANASRGAADRVTFRDGAPINETLAKFERQYKIDPESFWDVLPQWRDWLYQVALEIPDVDEVAQRRAGRLYEEVAEATGDISDPSTWVQAR